MTYFIAKSSLVAEIVEISDTNAKRDILLQKDRKFLNLRNLKKMHECDVFFRK